MTGTGSLLRLALRRDRWLAPIWVACLVLTAVSSVTATKDLYPDLAGRVSAAESFNATGALVAIYGPITDVTSLGQIALFKMVLLGALFLAFLCALVVRRHTRVDEESGRAELVLSTVVVTGAPLAAAVIEGVALSILTGLATAAVLTAAGLGGIGSLAFGLAWAGMGMVATGVAAVAVQLTASARTTAGVTAATLGVAYLVRAVGDASVGWLSWLSPFGWVGKTEAYDGNRWWVLALPLLTTAGLVAAAFRLRARRDLGSGLVPARPGPAVGSLASFGALLRRLVGPGLGAWLAALTILGVVLGGIASSAGDLITSEAAREMFERLGGVGAAQDTFLAAEMSITAAIVTAWAITVATRMAAEESSGRAETVLAGPVSRSTVFGNAAGTVLVGSLALLLGCGLGAGVSFGLATHDGAAVPRLIGAALVQAPAVWVVATLAIAAWSVAARWGSVGWVLLAGFLLLGQLGALLGLPESVLQLSPYAHAPKAPAEAVHWLPQGALVAVALLVLGGAWTRYRARDVG
jgi:ABC-2 type transport system permease protein